MKIGGAGFWEILIILLIVLIIFGPKLLPKLSRSAKAAKKGFEEQTKEAKAAMETDEPGEEAAPTEAAIPAAPTVWTCACGEAGNSGRFCRECGAPRP